jgi:hypothetical protein
MFTDNATVPSGKQIREAQIRARKEIIEKKVRNTGRKIMSTTGMSCGHLISKTPRFVVVF